MTAKQNQAASSPSPAVAGYPLVGAIVSAQCSSPGVAPAQTTIRVALLDDAAPVCALLRRSILECCVPDHNNDPDVLANWLGNKDPQTVATWFASPLNFAVVAVQGEQIVGVGLLTRKGKVCLCHVLPELRHTGIGRSLLNALEKQAIEWCIATVNVASTLVAQAFYRRNGYQPGRLTESCFGLETTMFSKQLPVSGRSCRCSGSA